MITKDNIPPRGNLMFFSVLRTDPLMARAEVIRGKTRTEHHCKAEITDATVDHGVNQSTIEIQNQHLISGPKIYQIMFQDV
jgi:hypothetical protein